MSASSTGRAQGRQAMAGAAGLIVLVAIAAAWTWHRATHLSREEIAFIASVACGTEYGSSAPRVRKWAGPVQVAVHGQPSATDREELRDLVAELDALVPIPIALSDDDGNLDVHFLPEAELSGALAEYRPGNDGFCWAVWDEEGRITRATVLIASEVDRPELRAHLIREELVQCLGPLRDSSRRPESIFYSRPSTVTELAPIDRLVLRALYDPAVPPGCDEGRFREADAADAPLSEVARVRTGIRARIQRAGTPASGRWLRLTTRPGPW